MALDGSAIPLSKIIADGVLTGTLETDTRGYVRFIPKPDELESIERYLADELTRTLEDYKPLFAEAVENIKCYRHVKVTLETGKAILPAPIARMPADHIIAATFTAIMNARPVFSFDPYFGGDVSVVVPTPPQLMPPPMPGMPPQAPPPMQVKRDTEEIAQNLERGYEFKIRERRGFERNLHKAVRGAVIGCPFWWKVCADPQSRDVMGPKAGGAFIDIETKYMFKQKGEVVQHYLVPFFNFIKPLDVADDELDLGPWCAERPPGTPDDIIRGFYSDDFFLIKDETDADALAKIVTDVYNPFQQAIAAMTESKSPQKQRQTCDRWLVWFYRDAKYKDPETGEKTIKRLNLIGDFHLGAKRLLNCYLNPNEHQSRSYVFMDQMEEGDSTVKILRWHQDVATHLMQAQIKNAFIANNLNTWSNEDTDASNAFKGTVVPGQHLTVPGKKDEDWGVFALGTNHESLLPTWQAVVAEARSASKVSAAQSGETLAGRTPAATMQQFLESGSQEQILFLRRLSRALSRVVRLDLETSRQFQPMGETVPIFDPVQKQLMEIPFRFPVGEMLDNFRIALTAADQALAKERDAQQIAMWKNVLMQDGEFIAKVSAALVDPRTTPGLVALYQKILERNERLVAKIIQLSDTDEKHFDLTDEIDGLVKEQNAARQQMQSAPPQPKEPEPPKINISLRADLPPDQEAALAQTIGLGGAPANQAPAPGGNVPGPGGPPNPGGPTGPPAQPGVPAGGGPPPAGNVQGQKQGPE